MLATENTKVELCFEYNPKFTSFLSIKRGQAYGTVMKAAFSYSVSLGRSSENDIVLGNSYFSRQQMKITYDATSGKLFVINLSQTVVFKLVADMREVILGYGDVAELMDNEIMEFPTIGVFWRVSKKYETCPFAYGQTLSVRLVESLRSGRAASSPPS